MKPSGPIPPYFAADTDGQLMISGIRADEIIDEAGGTPLFVYDNNIIGGQFARLKAAMPDGLAIYYTVSANPYEDLLHFLGRYVDGFRIVSRGELERLKAAKLAGIPITFAGPGKRDDELEAGISAGATISVESEGEARRAILAAERLGIQPKLAVRVNPPFSIEAGKLTLGACASPFGIDAGRAASVVQGLIEAGVDWRGVHIFAAAQCLDTDALIQAHKAIIHCAGDIADKLGLPLPELNLGGGFDVPCLHGDEPLDIYRMAEALHDTLCHGPELLATTRLSLELGRWLVGEAGVYLTRILDRTESCGETFLTTDGGGHHLLRATGCLLERGRGNYPIAIAGRYEDAAEEVVTVTGCLATPHDVFGDQVELPRAEPGDVIAIFAAGAYALTASPQGWESRPSAREILV
ncbi:pyridoxal-dependent decarboxylase, exosortase A system-associated [Sphingomonas hankyongi]|uniref:Pyridoxal-dependent decarboxylase, exosortase A system-associated n=1 Tax=Sphingomonas hankyongi TaxID=2908209 RepID=A0ABT0S4Q9_9SPHN|nr:pyridoxal-dependent decarboxylase, exosortase A system-associated [Sphingomonas hankyongi]MCL6730609.1 pyridoxal-dependent decarboxylase, exosortase A system-associated [Sphingomonas hankyongi]